MFTNFLKACSVLIILKYRADCFIILQFMESSTFKKPNLFINLLLLLFLQLPFSFLAPILTM